MINNDLLLLSGNDIPFYGGHINIHQPTIKEIGYIGEENFHVGLRFLLFDKNNLEDKSDLENVNDFDIFIAIMNDKKSVKHKTNAIMVLTLMFPDVSFKIEKDKILLQQQENINVNSSINAFNFEEFQDIVRQMFCFNTFSGGEKYNPADAFAQKIADKFKKRQELLAKKSEESGRKINLFSKYVSILAVGLQKNMNELFNYTVYQLFDEFIRFQKKQEFDIHLKAKMAGAEDSEEVENWMEEIHS